MSDAVVIGALAGKIDAITDVTKFNFFQYISEYSVTVVDTYEDIIDITGKGYLSVFIAQDNASTSKYKITIDGSVFYAGTMYADSPSGLIPISYFSQYTSGNSIIYAKRISQLTGGSGYFQMTNAQFPKINDIPQTSDTNTESGLLHDKVMFNESLKIEVKNASLTPIIKYLLEGAYI